MGASDQGSLAFLALMSGAMTSPAATLAANAMLRQRFLSSYNSSSQLAPGVAYSNATLAARSLLSVAYMVIPSGHCLDFARPARTAPAPYKRALPARTYLLQS